MKKYFAVLILLCCAAAANSAPSPNRFAGAFAHPNIKSELKLFTFDVPDPQSGGTTHSVTLTWVAPVIPTGSTCVLSGYNVKRSQSTGTETTIASVPVPTVTYLDQSISGGQKYFYVVTATAGTTCTESGPSNEVSVQIPLDQIGSPTGLATSGVK